MPEKIVIEPYGGLANRMRAVDSAKNLADSFNLTLNVNWELSPELNCSFFSLFEPIPSIHIHEYSFNPLERKTRNVISKSFRKLGLNLPRGFDKYLLDEEILELGRTNADIKDVVEPFKRIYIRTTHQYYKKTGSMEMYRPVSPLTMRINDITIHFDSGTVGLHIRRTDNAASIKHSPLEGFIDAINAEIANNKAATFFLATDSTETETILKSAFGDRILTRQRKLDRDSNEGIQDALIDLYCLARTKKIIGSYYSSFSEIAAQLSQIPLYQIYKA